MTNFSDFMIPVFQELIANAAWQVGIAVSRAIKDKEASGADFFVAQTLSGELVADMAELALTDLEAPDGVDLISLRSLLTAEHADILVFELLTSRLLEQPYSEVSKVRRSFECLAFITCKDLPESQQVALAHTAFEILDSICMSVSESLDNADSVTRESVQRLAGLSSLTATVRSIDRHLEALVAHSDDLTADDAAYRSKYGSHLQQRHGSIVLPDFEIERRVPIENLYVEPKLSLADVQVKRVHELLSNSSRVVVLGDPGGGKSTLSGVVVFRMAEGSDATPFLVTLREYGVDYASGLSIVEHIEKVLKAKYQSPAPTGWVNRVLLSGRAILIFDGLDELLDTSKRRDIKDAVESFCNEYPSAKILVTSRRVGYARAPLSEVLFDQAGLGDFTEDAVGQYASKWFRYALMESPDVRRDRVDAFLRESKDIEEIRRNPLMLSLMCVLYRGSNYIPENRLSLYEECAKLLFKKWDRSRGIRYPLEIEADIDASLMNLAHWMLTSGRAEEGVTEDALVRACASYLLGRRFEINDEESAQRAAEEFVSFCRGRAWVLADAGSTEQGVPLYTFAHRTFLEFYSASHLARMCDSPEQVAMVLAPRLVNAEWDVVGQLSVQIAQKTYDRGADRLLKTLLTNLGSDLEAPGQAGIIGFCSRALQIVAPGPEVTRAIVSSAYNFDAGAGKVEAPVLPPIFGCMPSLLPVVGGALEAIVGPLLANPSSPMTEAEVRAGRVVLFARSLSSRGSGSEESYIFWEEWSRSLAKSGWLTSEHLIRDVIISQGALEFRLLTLAEVFELHGVSPLWETIGDAGLGLGRAGTLDLLTGWCLGKYNLEVFQDGVAGSLLSEFSEAIEHVNFPLPNPGRDCFGFFSHAGPSPLPTLDEQQTVGAVVALCMLCEGGAGRVTDLSRVVDDPVAPALELVPHLWHRRSLTAETMGAPSELMWSDGAQRIWSAMSPAVRSLLTEWSLGRMNFWEKSHDHGEALAPGDVCDLTGDESRSA